VLSSARAKRRDQGFVACTGSTDRGQQILFAERLRLDAENFIRVIEALYLCRAEDLAA
jgi:hypothetical protein